MKMSYAEQIDRFKNNPINPDDVKAMIEDADYIILKEELESLKELQKDGLPLTPEKQERYNYLKDCEDKVWRNL